MVWGVWLALFWPTGKQLDAYKEQCLKSLGSQTLDRRPADLLRKSWARRLSASIPGRGALRTRDAQLEERVLERG